MIWPIDFSNKYLKICLITKPTIQPRSVYNEILNSGSQKGVIEKMQTRDELYEVLDYHSFEKKLDELFKQ